MDKIINSIRQGVPCLFHLMTGLYCPGCGGTRAVKYFLQGHLLKSIQYHPIVVYIAVVACMEVVSYWLSKRLKKPGLYLRHYELLTYIGIGIIIVNWMAKNLFLMRGIDLLS